MQYSVLGPIQVLRADGAAVPLPRAKERAILAALLVDPGRVVSVPAMIDRVWSEAARPATLSSLHASVSRLRKQLTGTTILTEAPGYRLPVEREELDALRFTDLLTAARRAFAEGRAADASDAVAEALSLWRGQPYADVDAAFVEQEASRLWDLRLAALELQGESDLLLGRDHDLVERLPPLVEEHPLREGMRATLMTALYRVGRQADALDLFERTRERFADELGVDPSPALQRLHTMILRHDAALQVSREAPVAPVQPVATAPAAPAEDALFGRDAERAVARRAWAAAEAGTARTLVVSGEAGIGKTRLLEDLAAHVRQRGGLVGWGRCADGGNPSAYWPWAEALSALAAQRGGDGTRRALAGRAAPAAALLLERPDGVEVPVADDGPVGARQRLFDGVAAFLAALAAEQPLLLALEDLHWADPETAQLTEHVLSAVAGVPVLMAATVRDPDETGGTAGRDLLAAAGRAGTGDRVVLHGLDVDAVRLLASARLASTIGEGVAARLHRRTDGNPFFVAELVRLLTAERAAGGSAGSEVPKTVQAVLERRFAHLGEDARRTLTAAAILGRAVDVRLLADMLGRRPLDLLETIDAAHASGVLVAGDDGRSRFAHALVQETLVAGLGPMRRAALHAQAAETIEAANAADPDRAAAAIARHLLAAGAVGDPRKAVRFSIAAAANALHQSAYGEAETHLRRAIEAIAADPGSAAAELELEARSRLGELLTLVHGYNAPLVVEERSRAFRLAVDVGTPAQLLSALWGAWGIALVSGDLPQAEAHAAQMLRSGDVRGDAMLLLAHHIALGQIRWHQGRLAEAARLLGRAVELVDAHGDEVLLAVFLQHPAVNSRAWLAIVLTLQGRPDEADAVSAEAAAFATGLGHAYTTSYLAVLESWRAVWAGRDEAALRISGHGLALAQEHGFDQLAAFLLGSHGWALALAGDTAAAVPEIRMAIDAFESLPAGHMFGHLLHGVLAVALLHGGDDAGALAETRIAVAESERTGETFYLPEVHLVAAQAARRTGAAEAEVERQLDAAAALAEAQGAGYFVARTAAIRAALQGERRASAR